MNKISSEIKKVEKELTKLYAEKAKEENRYAEVTGKTTAKYNEEMTALKTSFTTKMESLKKENQIKMGKITDDIAFYEKHKEGILKLEAQIANLDRKVDERMGKGFEPAESKDYEE